MMFFLHFLIVRLWAQAFAPSGCRGPYLRVWTTQGIAPAGASRGFPLAPAPFGIAFLHGGLHVRGSLSEYGIVVRCYLR